MFQNRFQDFFKHPKDERQCNFKFHVCVHSKMPLHARKTRYTNGMNLIGQIPEILPNYCKEDHEHLSKIFKNNVVGV